jgi:hypothetical protein
MSSLTDIDTEHYLAEFKEKYLKPMEAAHNKYQNFKQLPPAEQLKADDIQTKYFFLSNFVACVEATIEQNFILKNNQK